MRTYLRLKFSLIALFIPSFIPHFFLIHIVRELEERKRKKSWGREGRILRNEKKSKLISTHVISSCKVTDPGLSCYS